jgi:hypothetical protein
MSECGHGLGSHVCIAGPFCDAALGENDLAFDALEQALVERECFLAWLPAGRSLINLMSLASDPRWPVFIEKVKAAMQAGGGATV